MSQYVSKQEALRYLKLSSTTLKKYRLKGLLVEGIHWIRINSRCTRYNLELIKDWVQNRHDPVAHQRAIELYQAGLLSNQIKSSKKTVKSRSKTPATKH